MKMKPLPTVTEVIEQLGGRRAVAEMTGVSYNAVCNWCSWNRFPPRLHHRIFTECALRGIHLRHEFFHPQEAPRSAAVDA